MVAQESLVGTAEQSNLMAMLIVVLAIGASEIFVYTFLKWMAWYQHQAHDYSAWIHDSDHTGDEKAITEFIESINKTLEVTTTSTSSSAGMDSDSNSCPICLEGLNDEKVTLQCRHTFCKHCLVQWFKRTKTCPCCRSSANENKGRQDPVLTSRQQLPVDYPPWDASFSLFMY